MNPSFPPLSSQAPDPALVALYAPYCGGVNREIQLMQALDRLAAGEVSGRRPLHPSGEHPFVLRWQAGQAPQELSACELHFPATPNATYRFQLPTHQLVCWLMDLLEIRSRAAAGEGGGELPDAFWRWLILGETPPAVAEVGPSPPPHRLTAQRYPPRSFHEQHPADRIL